MNKFDLSSLPQERKLFYYMHQGLVKAKAIKDSAIFLIGEIRSGKSTTFNWITNPSCLLGKGNDLTAHYILKQEREEIALVKDSFVSVTLVQNMAAIQEEGRKVLLIDLPGFHDSRTVNEVMVVNFIINCCFSHSTDVKFIIVISHNQFVNINGASFANTLKEFIKYFRKMEGSQRKKIYKATSILVTSAPAKEYDTYKQMYLKTLEENLHKIKEMGAKNEEVREHYDHIEELLLEILQSKRLELFKKARNDESPSPPAVLSQFNFCDWHYYRLSAHIQDIIYPYNDYYQKLSSGDQEKIDSQIVLKVKQFQALQQIMADAIEEYLKAPYDRQMDLTHHFRNLEEHAERNQLHEDVPELLEEDIPELLEEEKAQEEPELRPLKIYRNLEQLINLTFQVQDHGSRSQEEQRNISYFQYLLSFFKKTIKFFADSFAVTPQSQQILNRVLVVFSEVIEMLKYITQINASLKSKCSYSLKQAILVMNRVYYMKENISNPFLKDLLREDLEDYPGEKIEELEKTITFLQDLDWKKLDPRFKFNISSKCYRALANNMRKSQEYERAIQYALSSFENHVKYGYCSEISKKFLKKVQIQQMNEIKFNQSTNKQLILQIYVSLYYTSKEDSLELFKKYNLFSIIRQSLEQLEKETETHSLHLLWEDYAQFYDSSMQHDLELSVYKRLEKDAQIRKQRRTKQVQQKIRNAEAKCRTTSYKEPDSDQEQRFLEDDGKVLKFVNEIRRQILKREGELSKEEMMSEIKHYYEESNEEVNPNQFEYKISRDPTYCDIITTSDRLIKMIKNRKVVLMLGKRSGKTTAYYWLMKKPLTIKRVGTKKYAYDLNCINIKNRINHKGFTPTAIPNIGQFQPGELLVDFANPFQTKIINVMIQINILKGIFQNCSAIKFLLVGKEENVMKDDLAHLLKLIQFCLHFLPKNKDLSQHFTLLLSHYEKTPTQAQIFQQFLEQFDQIGHKQQFQEKYRIKFQDKLHYKSIISSFSENGIIFFPKASKDIPECNFIALASHRWKYMESAQIQIKQVQKYIKRQNNDPNEIEAVKCLIKDNTKKIKSSLRMLGDVFLNSTENKKFTEEVRLQIDHSSIADCMQEQQICYNRYPQMFSFNQIFVFHQLLEYFRYFDTFSSSIKKSESDICTLIKLMKKLSFSHGEGMMVLSWIEAKFTEMMRPLSLIAEFQPEEFGYELSDLKVLSTYINWASHYSDLFGQNLQKYFRVIDIPKLLEEMVENEMNVSENLIRFINLCLELEVDTKVYHHVGGVLEQKMNEAVSNLKESTAESQNPMSSLYSCMIMLKLECKCYDKALKSTVESGQKRQLEMEFKIKLVQILKEIVVIVAALDKEFAFRLCDRLQCDACRCSVFDKLLQVGQGQQKASILKEYLDFCLQTGLKTEYIQLCKRYSDVATDVQIKEKYNSIKFEILQNRRQLIDRRRTVYDRMSDIRIQTLRAIEQEVKVYWESKQPQQGHQQDSIK